MPAIATFSADSTPVGARLCDLFPSWSFGECVVRDASGAAVGSFRFARSGGSGVEVEFHCGAGGALAELREAARRFAAEAHGAEWGAVVVTVHDAAGVLDSVVVRPTAAPRGVAADSRPSRQ